MRLRCFTCGKSVSTEVPDDTVFRATASCPECLEREAAPPEAHLLEVARESNAACTCGCPLSEHENYGEEGMGCADPMHECQLCSKAVAAEVARLRAALAAAETRVDAARTEEREAGQTERELYRELLYAVGKVWPGESRHQTALHYIRQAEAARDQAPKAALRARGEENGRG